MNVSVVVVTFNSATCVAECIQSIGRYLPDAEVIAVDNNSRDDTSAKISAISPRVRLVVNSANVGFGRACNIGAAAATRSHLLFLNPDVIITGANTQALGRLLALTPFGLVAPVPGLSSSGPLGIQPEHHWLRGWFDHTIAGLKPRELGTDYRPSGSGKKKTWVSGAMLLLEKREFLNVGGFDSRFFLYYEDRDLSARYLDAGLPIRETSALSGLHAGTASSRGDELGIQPLGWAFLSWIEYVYIHKGEKAARFAAYAGIKTLRTMSGLLRVGTFIPLHRAERKRRQILELIQFVEGHASLSSDSDPTVCADARRVLSIVL